MNTFYHGVSYKFRTVNEILCLIQSKIEDNQFFECNAILVIYENYAMEHVHSESITLNCLSYSYFERIIKSY